MSFLTVPYSLVAQTIFTNDGLRGAQDVWANAIARYQPGWLEAPQGVVGRLFVAETQPAVAELIDLGWVLKELSQKLTEKSTSAFANKVRHLLREDDPRKYEELKTELAVGAMLVQRARPLAFEPNVPADANLHEAPSSPDYAIRLADEDVAIEVTMLYVEALDTWQRLARRRELQRAVPWPRLPNAEDPPRAQQ